jgi:hypothetical protein
MSQYQGRRIEPPKALQSDDISTRLIREDIWRPAALQNDWSFFIVVGPEGSGKSQTCASILKMADPSFNVNRTHFEAVPFLEDLADENQPPATAMMGDEVGNIFGKRTWHDREQIEANQVLQTARDGNKIIGLTLPRLEELDSQLIGRAHILIEVQGTTSNDQGEDHAVVKWKYMNVSRDGRGEERKRFPRQKVNGVTRRVTRVRIGPPPEEYIEEYEPKKREWKQSNYDDTISKFEGDDSDDADSPPETPQEIVADILDRDTVEEYIMEVNGGQRFIDKDGIAFDYEIGDGKASKVKKGLIKAADLTDVQ